jgi:hypothetical protein
MRVPSTVAFNQFLMDNSNYPYTSLQATRNSFFCKWIMLTGRSNVTHLPHLFLVLANSHPNEVLLEMISSGRAKPLPPALSKIMDGMYWWGKAKNYAWYEHVVDNLGVVLDANDDKEPDIQEIVRFLISYQVKALLVEHFDRNSLTFHLLFTHWSKWFCRTYKKGDFNGNMTYSFSGMSIHSFKHVESTIAQVFYHVTTPTEMNSA